MDDLLNRHIAAAGPGRVILAGSSKSIAKALEDLGSDEPILSRIAVSPTDGPDPSSFGRSVVPLGDPGSTEGVALVVVVDRDMAAARTTHSRCHHFKNHGIPVVFGSSRPIYTATPGWAVKTGIDYRGMFKLAGLYAATLQQAGDYMEFGVFDGRTFSLAFHCMKHVVSRFYACDSFAGIHGSSANELRVFKDGDYFANEETFHHNMKVAGVDMARVRAVPGRFENSLTDLMKRENGIERVLVAHIDCDVYGAALDSLRFLTDVMVDGGLILFDEYDQMGASNTAGERRAAREWLADNPHIDLEEYRRYSLMSRAFIVHRSD